MTINPAWQEQYQAALLESNPEELPRRIEAAGRAIQERIEELGESAGSSSNEQRAIEDALRTLRVLAKTECRTQGPLQPGLVESKVAL
jgi:hypothetical protein